MERMKPQNESEMKLTDDRITVCHGWYLSLNYETKALASTCKLDAMDEESKRIPSRWDEVFWPIEFSKKSLCRTKLRRRNCSVAMAFALSHA